MIITLTDCCQLGHISKVEIDLDGKVLLAYGKDEASYNIPISDVVSILNQPEDTKAKKEYVIEYEYIGTDNDSYYDTDFVTATTAKEAFSIFKTNNPSHYVHRIYEEVAYMD